MKTAKLPKFDWKRVDEPNAGHTKDEWGKQEEDTPKTRIMEVYDLKWNVDKKKDVELICVTCGHNFKFFGSTFCSKRCYDDYFVSKST